MKIRSKLLIVCGLLLLPHLVSAAVLVLTERSSRSSLESARKVAVQRQTVTLALRAEIDDAEASIYEFQLEGRPESAARFQTSLGELTRGIESYRELATSEQELAWADELEELRADAGVVGEELFALRIEKTEQVQLFSDGSEQLLVDLRALGRSRSADEELYQETLEIMLSDLGEMQRSIIAFLLNRDLADEVRFATAEFEFNATLLRFERFDLTPPEARLFDSVVEGFNQVRISGRATLADQLAEDELVAAVSSGLLPEAQRVIAEEIQPLANDDLAAAQENLSDDLAAVSRVTLFIGAVALLAALGIVAWLIRGMNRDIAELRDGASRVAQGVLTEPVEVKGRGELGYVGGTFNEMMTELAGREQGLQQQIVQLAESERRIGELALKVAHVQEEERRLIGLDLHDGLTQIVLGARMHLSAGMILLEGADDSEAFQELVSADGRLSEAVAEASWMITQLRPAELVEQGLCAGLEMYVSKVADEAGWALSYRAVGVDDEQIPKPVQTATFRIVQEALSNARKYAETEAIDVTIGYEGGRLVTSVSDFGRGFDVDHVLANQDGSLGVMGMRERTELLGGEFEIDSAIGAGTTIRSSVPVGAMVSSKDEGRKVEARG